MLGFCIDRLIEHTASISTGRSASIEVQLGRVWAVQQGLAVLNGKFCVPRLTTIACCPRAMSLSLSGRKRRRSFRAWPSPFSETVYYREETR